MNNKVYGIFPFFSPLHPELALGSHIIDNFLDHFSFNLANKKKKDKIHFQELDEMVFQFFSSLSMVIIVTDVNIKNDITISILYVHLVNCPLTKTVHHAVFITSMEAELFTIKCGINQAYTKENVSKIIVVTDSIHATKKIFNSNLHPYQTHIMAILNKLC